MFQIDDEFLASLGLAALPQDEKEKMKAHIYETLEMRVGMRLASGMTDQQLTEFEGFMSGDPTKATDYLNKVLPNWQSDQTLQMSLENERRFAQEQGIQSNSNAVISEFAALKWLETNFPDYKNVVAEELEKLKNEIKTAAPQILAASNVAPAAQVQQPGQVDAAQQAYPQPPQPPTANPSLQQPEPPQYPYQPPAQPGAGAPQQ